MTTLVTIAITVEEWRPVVGQEGRYEVSNIGRVRSVDRVVICRTGQRQKWPGRVLKPSVRRGGHLKISLPDMSHRTRGKFIHTLVLEAFVGPRPEGMEACHGNGNPADNRVENLRWDTHSANMHDQVRHGVHGEASRVDCAYGHLLAEPNLAKSAGVRLCLACRRAHTAASRARREGREFDFLSIADDNYARIMSEGAAAKEPRKVTLKPHGTRNRARQGCRCEPCRQAAAAVLAQWRAAQPILQCPTCGKSYLSPELRKHRHRVHGTSEVAA